jgi:hypothetical protein
MDGTTLLFHMASDTHERRRLASAIGAKKTSDGSRLQG